MSVTVFGWPPLLIAPLARQFLGGRSRWYLPKLEREGRIRAVGKSGKYRVYRLDDLTALLTSGLETPNAKAKPQHTSSSRRTASNANTDALTRLRALKVGGSK